MKRKAILISLIVILICCLCFMIIIIKKHIKTDYEKKEVMNLSENNANKVNTTDENEKNYNEVENNEVGNNEVNSNEIDYNDTDYLFYNEDESGDGKYSREQLNNFDFEIDDIPEEIKNYIKDKEEFNIKVKEYTYKKGLVDASHATFETYEMQEENKLLITFELDDEYKTKIFIRININNNSMQIYHKR